MDKKKQYWFEKFYSIYKDCSLYALSIYERNGIILANVFYKDETGQKRVDVYNNYDTKMIVNFQDEGGNVECQNTPLVTALFQNEKTYSNQTDWFTYIQAW